MINFRVIVSFSNEINRISSLDSIIFVNQFIRYSLLNNLFFTTLLSLLKSTRVASNLPITNSSISDFMQPKSEFLANSDVSTTVLLFKSDFVA